MLRVIISTLRDVSNITLLMGFFLLIYMLIGMELFAFNVPVYHSGNIIYQPSFNSFLDAFLSVFIVLANDGWVATYLDHYRATNSYLASAFFISLLIFGQLILLNLFISVLIENFEQLSVKNDLVEKLSNLKKGSF
jgi:voltage-dependent calcium channel T type alpha-1I